MQPYAIGSIPIAGGEHEHALFGFAGLLGAGWAHLAQPDIASCGGFSAGRHIAALAHCWGLVLRPLVAPVCERDVQIHAAPGHSLTPAAQAFVAVLTQQARGPGAVPG